MTSTASSEFPLATDKCTTDCGNGAGTANSGGTVDSDAGAGGSVDNTFALSNGAMIAIIVIVVVVALLGSMFNPHPISSHLIIPWERKNSMRSIADMIIGGKKSHICYALLHRQEEGVEGP